MGLGGRVPELATFVPGLRMADTVFGLRRRERGGGGAVDEPFEEEEESRSSEEADDAVFTRELDGEVTPLMLRWSIKDFCFCFGGGFDCWEAESRLIEKAMTTGDMGAALGGPPLTVTRRLLRGEGAVDASSGRGSERLSCSSFMSGESELRRSEQRGMDCGGRHTSVTRNASC